MRKETEISEIDGKLQVKNMNIFDQNQIYL